MSMKLYVGNLAFSTSSQDLETLFAQAGTVQSVNVIEDYETGRSRGFAFIEMSSKEEAQSAISILSGKEINGREILVNEAKPREERSGSANRNGGSDRSSYNRSGISRW